MPSFISKDDMVSIRWFKNPSWIFINNELILSVDELGDEKTKGLFINYY